MAAQEAPHSSYNAPPRLLTAAPKQAQELLTNSQRRLTQMHKTVVSEWEHLGVLNRVWEGEMDPKNHLAYSYNCLGSKPNKKQLKNPLKKYIFCLQQRCKHSWETKASSKCFFTSAHKILQIPLCVYNTIRLVWITQCALICVMYEKKPIFYFNDKK